MKYPNYKDKHLEEAFFNPDDYIKYRKFLETHKNLPSKYIIIYYERILNYFKENYDYEEIDLSGLLTIYKHNDVGVVLMKGIGSPHATTCLEELIALGGKIFLNIGSAGGLNGFGTFLCEKAIRDEGTSHHYEKSEKYSYPDPILKEKLGKSLEKNNIEFKEGTTWTIDTPYRETKAEIDSYRKEGVATVEMEASALFTVAKYRNVKMAAAFVVTDSLNKEYKPMFHADEINNTLNKVFKAGVETLIN